jgi:2-dehydro-3-deoxyphosphogluconate aldolase/(4S)-4-hydroxy-2-oxoglutarate aldolase
MKGLLLGIGTIKTADEAKAFIDAGADFLVSPVFDNGVCDVAYMNKLLWIPGCMTPTEIHVSQQAGCQLVKLFPGNVLGPGFVEAILPLFNKMSFVVTGGVDTTEESIRSWFKAGVAGVGLGSKLINKQVLEKGAYSELTQKTKEVLAIVSSVNKR